MGYKTITRLLVVAVLALGLIIGHGGDSAECTATACLMTNNENVSNTENTSDSSRGDFSESYASPEVRLCRWDKSQVTISLDGKDGNRNPSESRRILEQASTLWNQKVESTIRLSVTEEDAPDIVVRFVPAKQLPDQVVGRIAVSYGAFSRTLCHATVTVKEGLPEDKCLQAVAHELGHALGIGGHSPKHDDLMFAESHLPAMVTRRDANTLRVGYSTVQEVEAATAH